MLITTMIQPPLLSRRNKLDQSRILGNVERGLSAAQELMPIGCAISLWQFFMSNSIPKRDGAATSSNPKQHERADGKLEVPIPIIAAGIAVAGSLVAALLVHVLSSRREARGRRATATVKFRAAFARELLAAEADTGGSINYMDVLRAAHDERHAQAVIEFEPFIPKAKLSSFRSDWNRYRYGENKDGSPVQPGADGMDHEDLYFLEYSIEWDLSRPERPRQNAIKRINALLDYARAA
jgi:hypothetical protein